MAQASEAALSSDRRIRVPTFAVIKSAPSFLAGTEWPYGKYHCVVEFAPRWCTMQPWVISAIAACALAHRANDGTISVENGSSANWAWRMGLANYLGVDAGAPLTAHEEAGKFIPLRTLHTGSDIALLLSDVASLLHLGTAETNAILTVISEMARNVLEHSESPHGAVASAQMYLGGRTRRTYVSIGIADSGVGIRKTINRNYKDVHSHRDAVLKAMEFGASGAVRGTYGSPDNAGAGLAISRQTSQASGGYFAVISGSAIFRNSLAKQPAPDSQLVHDIGFYPGTAICAEIEVGAAADLSAVLQVVSQSMGSPEFADDASELVRFS